MSGSALKLARKRYQYFPFPTTTTTTTNSPETQGPCPSTITGKAFHDMLSLLLRWTGMRGTTPLSPPVTPVTGPQVLLDLLPPMA